MTYAKIAGLMLGAIKINDTAIYSFALFEVTSMFLTSITNMLVGCPCIPQTLPI